MASSSVGRVLPKIRQNDITVQLQGPCSSRLGTMLKQSLN